MHLKYTAKRIEKYLLEPLFDKDGATWQAHHVTNPALIRVTGEPRALLGYRAGGDRDHYYIPGYDVYSSSLGLAVLNESASGVICRFPLPIMRIKRKYSLPQSPDEYAAYAAEHSDDISVMHDFRLYEHNNYLYVIYHDGSLLFARDCIRRMALSLFLEKVERSIVLSSHTVSEIEAEWNALWWKDDVWEDCGVNNGRLLFPLVDGKVSSKTDIAYFKLKDTIQLMRRPIPDVSVLPTDDSLCGRRTIDGNQDYGVLEQCIRPGYYDNSHIGPNSASPTLAHIGDHSVYIDVVHGVNNPALAADGDFYWHMSYSPFFKIKDAETGDLLYYSDEPILDDHTELWSEYSERGRWISALTHRYITFAGGQTPMIADKNGEDDLFTFVTGVGDTAIARAEFTIRSLVPKEVLDDIKVRFAHLGIPAKVSENAFFFPAKAAGWSWVLRNDREKRGLAVDRFCTFPEGTDHATRYFYNRPGYFDSDFMLFDGKSIRLMEGLGWCLIYKGIRWIEKESVQKTEVGFGILVLDEENMERILYRSFTSIRPVVTRNRFTTADDITVSEEILENITDEIPRQVQFEIHRSKKLVIEGKHWRSEHTMWLEERSKRRVDSKTTSGE